MKLTVKRVAWAYGIGGAVNLALWALHSNRGKTNSGLAPDYGIVVAPTAGDVAQQFFLWPLHIYGQLKGVLGMASSSSTTDDAGNDSAPPIDTSTPVLEPGGALAS